MSKIYCASDFHIGDETANYPKIKDFLEIVRQDADKLILVGDTWDLWRNTAKTITSKDPFKSIHELLLDVAKDIPIVVISGNHDYALRRKFNFINIEIKNDFVEDGIFYTHGHKFDIQQQIGLPFCNIITDYFPFIYQLFFKKPSEIIDVEEKNTANMIIYREVRKFMYNKPYNYIVMGHTHNPIINNKIVDCGDFIDSLSYIIIENGIPKLHKLDH